MIPNRAVVLYSVIDRLVDWQRKMMAQNRLTTFGIDIIFENVAWSQTWKIILPTCILLGANERARVSA